ncbi:hypothetical protein TR51_25995 [Kitasatospora griseola]|uniref:Uncharacterized protein n=1 Tax=Kitasatospora griseola TaxID=2064 RepID=A0A0D0PV41_KITGR|nr:hypothetical protein [Kitasatospora griseola]KIQ62473.1 hypothetical protein TR51_25995 [Kitasatospora griseola]
MTTPEPTNPYAGPPQAPAAPNPYAGTPQTPPAPGGVPLPPPAPAEQAWGAAVAPPTAPAVPVVKNVPLAVLAGVGAALAAALLYGFIVKAMEREFSVLAIGIGAAVGFAVGKIGGAHRALPPVAALITLFGVFFGELFGLALMVHEKLGADVLPLFTEHFDLLFEGWKADFDLLSVLFLGLGAFFGASAAKKAGDS